MPPVIVPLGCPIMVDGKEVKSLSLDLDGLTCGHMIAAAEEAQAGRPSSPITNLELDARYHMMLARMAAVVTPDVILGLGIRDATRVRQEVMVYLLEMGSPPSSGEPDESTTDEAPQP